MDTCMLPWVQLSSVTLFFHIYQHTFYQLFGAKIAKGPKRTTQTILLWYFVICENRSKVVKMPELKHPNRFDWANVRKGISSLTKYVAVTILINIYGISGRLVYIYDTSFFSKHMKSNKDTFRHVLTSIHLWVTLSRQLMEPLSTQPMCQW